MAHLVTVMASMCYDVYMEMTVKRAYKMRLEPTPRQCDLLKSHEGAARWGFNWALRLQGKVNKYFKFKNEFFDAQKVAEGLDWDSMSKDAKGKFYKRHNDAAKAFAKDKNAAFQARLLHLLVHVAGWDEERAKNIIGNPAKGPSVFTMNAYWAANRDRDMPWWEDNDINTWAVKSAIHDAYDARERFISNSGTSGAPKFKRRGQAVGIRLHGTVRLSDRHSRRLIVPNIAPNMSAKKEKDIGYYEGIRIQDGKNARRLRTAVKNGARITSVTLTRVADYWYASVLVTESITVPAKPTPTQTANGPVGVDMGVSALATLSDGTVVENNRERRKTEGKVAAIQRGMAKKQGAGKGEVKSNRYRKLTTRKHRIEHKTALRRKERMNQFTATLAKNYGTVCVESLNVSGMTKRPKVKPDPNNPGVFLPNGAASKSGLAKSILDVGFYEFQRQMTYKSSWYKPTTEKVVFIPRFAPSSQTCSACGAVRTGDDKLKLEHRTFTCLSCNHVEDRDLNAARNILSMGMDTHKE